MRTTVEENTRMGEIFAGKLNAAKGRVAVFIPMKNKGGTGQISRKSERRQDRTGTSGWTDGRCEQPQNGLSARLQAASALVSLTRRADRQAFALPA